MKKSVKKLRTLRDLETKQAVGCGDMSAPPAPGEMGNGGLIPDPPVPPTQS